ncbi:helicase-associated domain-containing protein [Tsukamurella soli]|uniref:helicase-associated domain-containing protein n=1 Tax=Tsukamurella soli TaxID=644556 RepID=UPI00361E4EF6
MAHAFAADVALVAELESAGGAAVHRVTEAALRRALDSGRSAAELHAFFAAHSSTPVPQTLTYLVDDVARRHGQLRAGLAASFLRSDDPALIATVLASPAAAALALRAIAPTVVVCQAPLADLVTGLRAAGFAAAAEDSTGTVVDLRPPATRLPVARARPRRPCPARSSSRTRPPRCGDRTRRAWAQSAPRPVVWTRWHCSSRPDPGGDPCVWAMSTRTAPRRSRSWCRC